MIVQSKFRSLNQSNIIIPSSIMGPYASHCMNLEAILSGSMPRATFDPSKGKTGIRLKTPSIMLKRITNSMTSPTRFGIVKLFKIFSVYGESQGIIPSLIGIAKTAAVRKFEIGPALATMVVPFLYPFLKLNGLKGTGLPQPNPTNASITEPT